THFHTRSLRERDRQACPDVGGNNLTRGNAVSRAVFIVDDRIDRPVCDKPPCQRYGQENQDSKTHHHSGAPDRPRLPPGWHGPDRARNLRHYPLRQVRRGLRFTKRFTKIVFEWLHKILLQACAAPFHGVWPARDANCSELWMRGDRAVV